MRLENKVAVVTGAGGVLCGAFATTEADAEDDFAITSSVKEFHSPHEGHLPNHLGASKPQLRQKKAFLIFAIVVRM